MKRILFVLFCTLACFNVFAGDVPDIDVTNPMAGALCMPSADGDNGEHDYVWWYIERIYQSNSDWLQRANANACQTDCAREGNCIGCTAGYDETGLDMYVCWSRRSSCGVVMNRIFDFNTYGDTDASYTHTFTEIDNGDASMYKTVTDVWQDNQDYGCIYKPSLQSSTLSCNYGYKLAQNQQGFDICTKKKTCSDYQTQETSKVWEWPADKTNYASYNKPETSEHIDAHYEGNPADETYVPTSCYLPHGGDAKRYFDDKGIFHFNTTCQWHSTF